jgi:hypothetical protein
MDINEAVTPTPPFLRNGQVPLSVDQLLAAYGSTQIEANLARMEIVRLEGVVAELRQVVRDLTETKANLGATVDPSEDA